MTTAKVLHSSLYEIEIVTRQRGIGEVYRAYHAGCVATRCQIPIGITQNHARIARFDHEVNAASALAPIPRSTTSAKPGNEFDH